MAEVTALELAFRLAVAAVATLGPTIPYVGLWRVLDERLAERGVPAAPKPAAVDVLATTSEGVGGNR